MSAVEIVLEEGPVLIPSLAGSGVDRTYPLWNEMSASEFFPPHVGSAFYVLSLRKPVAGPDEVSEVEAELVSTLRLLATAWPFSGGSFMILDSRDVITTARFQSNASAVRDQLLALRGERSIAASATFAYETVATYQLPPLERASTIANAAATNPGLRRLLRYQQTAWIEYYHGRGSDRGCPARC